MGNVSSAGGTTKLVLAGTGIAAVAIAWKYSFSTPRKRNIYNIHTLQELKKNKKKVSTLSFQNSQEMATKNLSLNLIIDESSSRVLYAESNKDFVDVLLSFLTLPLGTLVSVANKSTMIPCLDNLYKSVQGLSNKYFQPGCCKEMLLKPNHAAEFECLDLCVDVAGSRALRYYICSKDDCDYELMSVYANVPCACRSKMSRKAEVVIESGKKEKNEGVFMKGAIRFIITDELTVAPLSTQAMLQCFAGVDTSSIVERQVKVGLSEIVSMLHQSLIYETPLTNIFLAREADVSFGKKDSTVGLISVSKSSSGTSEDTVGIKLIVDKQKSKVIYAECNKDFIDILFSFLTYPSGFVVKSLDGKSHITCFDNLYRSVLNKSMTDCFNTYQSKDYLVNPKLPSHLILGKSLIKSDELIPKKYYMCRTPGCDSNELSLVPNAQCKCKRIRNKRMKFTGTTSGTYGSINQGVVSESTYIVTDDLVVTPLCSVPLRRLVANSKEGIEEIPVNIGEKEVLALLEATLCSQSALTDALLIKEKTASNVVSDVDARRSCVPKCALL